MHTEHGEVRHHKNRHMAERFEGMLGIMMVIAIALLAAYLIYMMITGSGDSTPTWMR
jgi:cell division protein FtsL